MRFYKGYSRGVLKGSYEELNEHYGGAVPRALHLRVLKGTHRVLNEHMEAPLLFTVPMRFAARGTCSRVLKGT
jgi:hypothetical protein